MGEPELTPSPYFVKTSLPQVSQDELVQMTGTYTRVSEENYEEVLKALNVGFMLRKAALASTPTMTITESGGQWNMVTKTTMKSIDLKFRLGEEFDEETTDGNKLITNQRATGGGKDALAVREFSDDGVVMTITVDGVSCKQVFKRT